MKVYYNLYNLLYIIYYTLFKSKIKMFGKPQSHSWTKLKIMSEDSTIQLKAMIPGFEEMKYGLIIRPWKK